MENKIRKAGIYNLVFGVLYPVFLIVLAVVDALIVLYMPPSSTDGLRWFVAIDIFVMLGGIAILPTYLVQMALMVITGLYLCVKSSSGRVSRVLLLPNLISKTLTGLIFAVIILSNMLGLVITTPCAWLHIALYVLASIVVWGSFKADRDVWKMNRA